MLQVGRSRVRNPIKWLFFFSIYPILQATLGSGVHSASNRKIMFLASRARQVRMHFLAVTESQKFRNYAILKPSTPHKNSRCNNEYKYVCHSDSTATVQLWIYLLQEQSLYVLSVPSAVYVVSVSAVCLCWEQLGDCVATTACPHFAALPYIYIYIYIYISFYHFPPTLRITNFLVEIFSEKKGKLK
jgi:hypothetical protein